MNKQNISYILLGTTIIQEIIDIVSKSYKLFET